MPPPFPLRILTPEKTLYSGRAVSLKAPGTEGAFGVLARHAPMISALATGPLDVAEEGGQRRVLATSGGFAEVSSEGVTVLAETAEFGPDIDVARAEASAERARQRLAGHAEDLDRARAQASLLRALNRLRVAAQRPAPSAS